MIFWQNRILTNVKIALGSDCPTVVSVRNNSSATFPACSVRVVSDVATAEDLDMGDGENAVTCGVAVEVFSRESLTESFNLIATVNKAMYQMGFKRREGPRQVTNAEQPDIYRVVARYVRTIGANDTIKRFED